MLYTRLTRNIKRTENMLTLKLLFQATLIFTLVFSQIDITIYNQGRALINEIREVNLGQKGKQSLIIRNIPNTADPSSINLYSDNIQFISKEFLKNPITNQSLLNASIGKEIELVKYNEEGNISFSIMGKLISNINLPVFEIDGKVVIDPPYSYRFDSIPGGISDYPYMNCVIQSKSRKSEYHLSYITTGLNWGAEYNLRLISDKMCDLEGWYSIRNDLNLKYDNTDISLVSGQVNFEKQPRSSAYSNQRKATAMPPPEITETGEYSVFHLPEKINLFSKSQVRHQFVSKSEIPYESIYHISHSLQRYRRNTDTQSQNIPVYIRLELMAEDIGRFQLPGGSYKVYEQNNASLTYIGSDSYSIVEGTDKIKLETGRTQDILCTFTIQGFEISRDVGEAQINAVFENRKDKTITVVWIEKFSDGRWDILKSTSNFERLDAYSAKFNVKIQANSKEEISFKARIEKM